MELDAESLTLQTWPARAKDRDILLETDVGVPSGDLVTNIKSDRDSPLPADRADSFDAAILSPY